MRAFFTIAGCSAAALLLVAVAMALVFAVSELLFPSELWTVANAFWIGFCVTLLLGGLPTLLLGAPAYWLLWRRERAAWLPAALVGGMLGSLVMLLDPAFLFWGAGCGLATGVLTHLIHRCWVRLATLLA